MSSDAIIGGNRTEIDECIEIGFTMLEIIVELNLSSDHVYEVLKAEETKQNCVDELLRLRIDWKGSLEKLFVSSTRWMQVVNT